MDQSNSTPDVLWKHKNPQSSQLWAFKTHVEQKYSLTFKDYEDLRQWSIRNLEDSWGEIWEFVGIKSDSPFDKVVTSATHLFPRPQWFTGTKMNFAQNLLYPEVKGTAAQDNDVALFSATELSRATMTWGELRSKVHSLSKAMEGLGVKPLDRVAGYVGNNANAVVAMLASTALGAIWTGISPDSGVTAVLDRLQQIEPKLLFADNAVIYNGRAHETGEKLKGILEGTKSLQGLVIFETSEDTKFDFSSLEGSGPRIFKYKAFVQQHESSAASRQKFQHFEADHPVYILYSSGTTGKPKCIVHGAIGTLIQHKKEHILQCDTRPGDRMFYFTTCTWMMWHWLISALASGVSLVLYDGSPFRPLDSEGNGEIAMPKLLQELKVTHFGTSAKYLSLLEQKKFLPRQAGLPLEKLKAIYSTGSPLAPSTFEFVYQAFGPDINLGSITGGTDIISLFGAPSPLSPVYKGEIQVRGLGMAVEAWNYAGKDVTSSGEPGDLVCVKPFPCQPVYFWNDEDNSKYKNSYFTTFPGVWHHGDFIRINPTTGGLTMLGRSDGVLKPSGVRFGSAEIYNILLKHFSFEVEDALCIGRRRESDTDETVVLFLKMAGDKSLTDGLINKIKSTVRSELSARHVPGVIDTCPEIPVTTNGKKIEVVVKQILSGTNVKTSASVANPECLEYFQNWAASH